MITKEQAVAATHGKKIYHVSRKNADGSPLNARVNGNCQTWKTRPNEFSLPVKRGLKEFGKITQDNAGEWTF